MKKTKFVTVIIPTLNNSKLTLDCINSISSETDKTIDLEIIVIDNGSNEQELQLLEKQTYFRLISLTTNHGYGPAINTAIKIMNNSSDVVVLNNDTIVRKNWLINLQKKAYENIEYGIIGPVMLYGDGKIQSSGGFLTSKGWGDHNRDFLRKDREVEYCPGACLYIKNELIRKLDYVLFDETFFPAYSEDVWLGHEARKYGYKSIITPESIIFHLEGMTSKNDTMSQKDKIALEQAKLDNREKLFKKIEEIDYTDYNKKHKIAFVGAVQGGWSYVTVLRNLTKALDKTKDVDVAIYNPNYHQFYAEPDWAISKMLSKPKDFNRVSVRYAEGNTMFMSFGDKKIGYTTHESVSVIPKEWVYQLNQLDQVWTTTEYTKSVFVKSDVIKPIFVIPHGINFETYNPNVKPAKLSYTKGFTFYVNNIYGPRKNIDFILKAYVDEFTSDDNVTLLLKCNFNDMLKPRKPIEYFSKFQRQDGKTPKVEIIENWISEEKLAQLYRKSDCFIGIGNEGLGLTNLESMSCGTPCIAPSWGGLTEFCDDKNSLMLKRYKSIPARQDFLFGQYANTHWNIPDILEIRQAMRFAYENQDKMKQLGKIAYESVNHMTWDWVASKCVTALNKLTGGLNENIQSN